MLGRKRRIGGLVPIERKKKTRKATSYKKRGIGKRRTLYDRSSPRELNETALVSDTKGTVFRAKFTVRGIPVTALVDSRASNNYMSKEFTKKIGIAT